MRKILVVKKVLDFAEGQRDSYPTFFPARHTTHRSLSQVRKHSEHNTLPVESEEPL